MPLVYDSDTSVFAAVDENKSSVIELRKVGLSFWVVPWSLCEDKSNDGTNDSTGPSLNMGDILWVNVPLDNL